MAGLENPRDAPFVGKPPELADSSASVFNNYSRMAEKEHKKMAKSWQKDADGILVFTGLFSASVAVLLAVTVLDLKQNPQDISAFYLENIYKLQLHADTNPSQPPTEATPPPFSPQKYVVVVNTLWFLSLIIGLTSAILALMLQQWARRYLRIAQNLGHTPHDVARIHAYFSLGVNKLGFSSVSDFMTLLIHTSLFLFFTGLLIYLFNINRTIFHFVLGWIAVAAMAYLIITITPILRVDSPYYSPFSSWIFQIYGWLLARFSSNRLRDRAAKYSLGFSKGIEKIVAENVTNNSSTLDSFILNWTLDAHVLASDRQRVQLFNDIYDFYGSNIVPDPGGVLATLDAMKFSSVSVAFMKRTFPPSSLSNQSIMNQFKTYLNFADLANGVGLLDLFSQIEYRRVVQTIDVGQSLSQNRRDGKFGLLAQVIIADVLVARFEEGQSDGWLKLAAKQLRLSNQDIDTSYSYKRDNLLFANWILIAPQISDSSWAVAKYILPSLSGFNIQAIDLAGVQNEFCVNWNEILAKAVEPRNGNGSAPHFILSLVHHFFIVLHHFEDTFHQLHEDPFYGLHILDYPMCRNPRAVHPPPPT